MSREVEENNERRLCGTKNLLKRYMDRYSILSIFINFIL